MQTGDDDHEGYFLRLIGLLLIGWRILWRFIFLEDYAVGFVKSSEA